MSEHNLQSDDSTRRKKSRAGGSKKKVTVVRNDAGSWELRDPPCARRRREDLEEVEQMIAAGENEIAQDELRWLLSECRDFIAAHKLLGDLAIAAGDVRLARGHYGYAYQIGVQAIDRTPEAKSLPYKEPANRMFFEAARGLAQSLNQLGKRPMAREVIKRLRELDPSDPLKLNEMKGANSGQGEARHGNKKRRRRRSRKRKAD